MSEGIPHQAIYRRWRAQTFSEIVGQEAVVATLRNAVRTGQVSHAILFTGPRGTGKTSLARILAKALNCTNLAPSGDPCDTCPSCVSIREGTTLDVIEIDAASNRGIDDVRELRDRLAYPPGQLRKKVYILDEAHQITRDAWNALLKSLEEPPEFVAFMFASTHPQGFPPAILSRLQRFDVRRLTVDEIAGKLERILAGDGREADPEAIRLVARLAAGGMRDAESILDQLLSSTGERIDAAAVRDLLGLADAELVGGFVTALATGDVGAGVELLDRLEERGRDLRAFLDQVVDVLRERLVTGLGPGAGIDPALTASARRLASIDPTRLGAGGLRLQLELALLGAGERTAPQEAGGQAFAPATGVAAGPAVAAASPAGPIPGGAAGSRSAGRAAAGRPAPAGASSQGPDSTGSAVRAPDAAVTPAPALKEREPAEEPVAAGPGLAGGRGAAAAPPVAASSTTAPPSAAPVLVTGDDLDRLRRGWSQVVAAISKSPPLKPLISVCRPIGIEGNVVTLGFPEEQAFLKDVAERRRPNLEDGIGGFLGHPVGVRCVATNLDLLPPLPSDEDASLILEEAQRIFADDLADVPEVS